MDTHQAHQLAKKLIRTVARAFYPDDMVVVLDTLVRDEYLVDNEMDRRLQLPRKQLRKLMSSLEAQGLIKSEVLAIVGVPEDEEVVKAAAEQKEKEKEEKELKKAKERAKLAAEKADDGDDDADDGAAAEGEGEGEDGKEPPKKKSKWGAVPEPKNENYWYIDYQHFVNVVRWRVHSMQERVRAQEKEVQMSQVVSRAGARAGGRLGVILASVHRSAAAQVTQNAS